MGSGHYGPTSDNHDLDGFLDCIMARPCSRVRLSREQPQRLAPTADLRLRPDKITIGYLHGLFQHQPGSYSLQLPWYIKAHRASS